MRGAGNEEPYVDLSQARSNRAESPQSCLALAGLQALEQSRSSMRITQI